MFLNPSKVVDNLDIRPGMKVAEFGSGSGHFTIEMARRIGSNGMAYAFDVQQSPLEVLKSRAEAEHLTNIEIGRVDLETEESTRLKAELLDLVLLSNVLFQSENKENIAKEAFRILKAEGRAVLIEPARHASAGVAGGDESRASQENLSDIFLKTGFKKDKDLDVGSSHYGIIFKK